MHRTLKYFITLGVLGLTHTRQVFMLWYAYALDVLML